MLRVLVITYYWPPAGGAGVQRWLKLSKFLPEYGVLPTVITVDETKATYPILDESLYGDVHRDVEVIRTNSFEPLKWYGRLVGKKHVPYGGFANVSRRSRWSWLSRFLRGNLFIPDARKGWNKFACRAAEKAIREEDIHIVITTGPPHSTHLVGLKLKDKYGLKWVADFRDPWTDIFYNDLMNRTKVAERKDRRMEKEVLDRADMVVANCKSNAELLRNKGDRAPIEVVENGYDANDFENMESERRAQFRVVYTGTMAASYNPSTFVSAFKRLVEKAPDKVQWHFAGYADAQIIALLKRAGIIENCIFHGYVSHSDAVRLMSEANILLNLFPETKNDLGIPGKCFEYLAARRAILNIGPKNGDAALIIAECESGVTFNRTEEGAIFNFLNKQFEEWLKGKSNRMGNEKVLDYSRQNLAQKYVRLMESL